MSEQQRDKIISLLETAQKLAIELEESNLAYLIERAIDEARVGAYPLQGQAPYFPGPPRG
jgi:hypothetical protein